MRGRDHTSRTLAGTHIKRMPLHPKPGHDEAVYAGKLRQVIPEF